MISDAINALTDRIYEAAAVPELWQAALVDFARLAQAKDAVLIASRGTSLNRWIVSSPEFDELVLAHSKRFPTNERTRRLLAAQHAGFIRDCDVFRPGETDAEPVFAEFLIPRGYGSGIATVIRAPSGDNIIVHADREQRLGPYSRNIVERLDRLRPHLARAALLSARLEMERATATAKAIELIGLPAAVLGRGGRIMVTNGLMNELIPQVVQDRPSRLALTEPAADALLSAALDFIVAAPHDVAVRSIPIGAGESHPPIIIHLVPVRGAAHDIFSQATAVLVATPVVCKDVPSAGIVQGLFDLTPAEAKLAALVAAGYPPRKASLKLGVSEETARTTLKRVLAKTGLHRQADLVGLLRGVSLGALSQR